MYVYISGGLLIPPLHSVQSHWMLVSGHAAPPSPVFKASFCCLWIYSFSLPIINYYRLCGCECGIPAAWHSWNITGQLWGWGLVLSFHIFGGSNPGTQACVTSGFTQWAISRTHCQVLSNFLFYKSVGRALCWMKNLPNGVGHPLLSQDTQGASSRDWQHAGRDLLWLAD